MGHLILTITPRNEIAIETAHGLIVVEADRDGTFDRCRVRVTAPRDVPVYRRERGAR